MVKPDKEILEYKKAMFLKEVEKAASSLNVKVPKVKFWNHYEDHFDKGERAHIHTKENLICIAEPELERMFEEDIRKTATHEVTHLHHLGHGMEFQNTHNTLEIGSWERPPGTVGALPEDYVRPKEEKVRKTRPIKYKCNLCEKRGKTKKCPHCGGYFCKEHIKPQEPYIGRVPKNRQENKNTHICSFAYSKYFDEEKNNKNGKINPCGKCGKSTGLPFKCKRCGEEFCGKHKLPEDHDCEPFKEQESHNQERWQNIIKSAFGYGTKRYIKKREIPYKKKEKDKGETKKVLEKKMPEEEFNFKKWANHRVRRKYPFQEKFDYLISLSVKFVLSLVIFGISCTKLAELNQIKIIFIQFGGVILLVSLYFLLNYSYKIIKELYDLFDRQKNGVKFLIVFLLIILLISFYFFKGSFVDSLVNIYNRVNFKDISPFSF